MTQSSCLCGSSRISFTTDPILTFRCHCLDERKLTGAAFALNVLYSTSSLTSVSGSLSTWSKVADNGNTITSHFCPGCATLLYRTTTGHPGIMIVKAGCIDCTDEIDAASKYVPQMEIYTRSRVPWLHAVEGAEQIEVDLPAA